MSARDLYSEMQSKFPTTERTCGQILWMAFSQFQELPLHPSSDQCDPKREETPDITNIYEI